MTERLQKQLDFSLEIDKEKNITRQTHLSGHGRAENDAEHAWHMAIMAYFLKADRPICPGTAARKTTRSTPGIWPSWRTS